MNAPAHSHTDAYWLAIDRLEQIVRDHDDAAPVDLRSTLVEAIGDLFDIWPESLVDGQNTKASFECL